MRQLVSVLCCGLAVFMVTTSAFQSPLSSIRPAIRLPKTQVHTSKAPLEKDQLAVFSSSKVLSNANHRLNRVTSDDDDDNDDGLASRRIFLASALMGVGAMVGGGAAIASADDATTSTADDDSYLRWKKDPVNKRSGVTVFDAEKAGYNVLFVTYLSRFLLAFDKECQRWWFSRADDFPRGATAAEINELRMEQFGAFSASVEVGLQAYEGPDGPKNLMNSLLKRYCPEDVLGGNVGTGDSDGEKKRRKQRREVREARRQIALLFGLLEKTQPVQDLTKLLAAVDNGYISSVKMKKGEVFGGYSSGEPVPLVEFPPPEAGDDYEPAAGRVLMEPTGKLLYIDVVEGGSGYSTKTPLNVIVTPPRNTTGIAATAKAKVVSNGPEKGSIESIQLVTPGSGYSLGEPIRVELPFPEDEGGRIALASPVLELRVGRIEVTKQGSGYAAEKPLKIKISPPISQNANSDSSSTGKVDGIIVGVATPKAEKTSFTQFRKDSDTDDILKLEQALEEEYDLDDDSQQSTRISGKVSGADSNIPLLPPFFGGGSTSSRLLNLLPEGVGLEYDLKQKRYALNVDTNFRNAYPGWMQQRSSDRPINPDFGPRGRSPIERDMELGFSTYLRFSASGAICASGVHLALTPLDVVKTKVQTNPAKYPGVISSFKTIFTEEGVSTFFTGWEPTFVGNFLSGGVLYMLTELIRRYLIEAAGADAMSLEVPIILVAAGIASSVGSFLICPFEALRIRSVAQPNFAPNIVGVATRMVEEEGYGSLVNAIPVFLAKNIPYAMTKFTVFDISTERLYEAYPAANEDLKLSLLITLCGGILGGIAAAIISNPADAVISEMKKAKSDMAPLEAVDILLERAGVAALFKGLPLRMVFYSLVASLQFLVYDSVRFALGIGPDDLKLYLDVLGGALRESGGPI